MPVLTPGKDLNKPLVNNPFDADLWGGQLNTNADILNDNETLEKTILTLKDLMRLG